MEERIRTDFLDEEKDRQVKDVRGQCRIDQIRKLSKPAGISIPPEPSFVDRPILGPHDGRFKELEHRINKAFSEVAHLRQNHLSMRQDINEVISDAQVLNDMAYRMQIAIPVPKKNWFVRLFFHHIGGNKTA